MRDKSDRATAEQVMDPRTRMILFKLLSRQIIGEVNGCISTGKEANVYHATAHEDVHLAIKVGPGFIQETICQIQELSREFRLIFKNNPVHHKMSKIPTYK